MEISPFQYQIFVSKEKTVIYTADMSLLLDRKGKNSTLCAPLLFAIKRIKSVMFNAFHKA